MEGDNAFSPTLRSLRIVATATYPDNLNASPLLCHSPSWLQHLARLLKNHDGIEVLRVWNGAWFSRTLTHSIFITNNMTYPVLGTDRYRETTMCASRWPSGPGYQNSTSQFFVPLLHKGHQQL